MRYILTIFFLLLTLDLFAPSSRELIISRAEGINPYEALWRAVCIVESSGNPLAYNLKEEAYGIVQVRPIRLKHYNTMSGDSLSLRAMFDPAKAKRVFMYFCQDRDFETIAKEWNGRGKQTVEYWQKVQSEL